MSSIEELVEKYVRRVRELADHVKGNEQATKQSLIGPFLTMLGYDLTDPRECIPEYKVDFGKDRSSKPIDWAFLNGGNYAFFVEAKEVGRKLAGYDEQLADYFAKDPNVKLGILTNGAQWKFFTDVEHANVMDKEPFARWDILADDAAPLDVLKLLQKSQFNPELIRAFAQRKRAQNLLLSELTRLLEPSSEFTKLAVANLETPQPHAGRGRHLEADRGQRHRRVGQAAHAQHRSQRAQPLRQPGGIEDRDHQGRARRLRDGEAAPRKRAARRLRRLGRLLQDPPGREAHVGDVAAAAEPQDAIGLGAAIAVGGGAACVGAGAQREWIVDHCGPRQRG